MRVEDWVAIRWNTAQRNFSSETSSTFEPSETVLLSAIRVFSTLLLSIKERMRSKNWTMKSSKQAVLMQSSRSSYKNVFFKKPSSSYSKQETLSCRNVQFLITSSSMESANAEQSTNGSKLKRPCRHPRALSVLYMSLGSMAGKRDMAKGMTNFLPSYPSASFLLLTIGNIITVTHRRAVIYFLGSVRVSTIPSYLIKRI